MALPTHDLLNRLLPAALRTGLRRAALLSIPSMRHLDMPCRLRQLRRAGFAPRTIYDIGAARGTWARLAHDIWPEATIAGFEPNASHGRDLDILAGELPAFRYYRAFLGPRRQQEVRYTDRKTQTSLLFEDTGAGEASAPMLVLDDLIERGEIPAPDFLKLDVQGYELEVLKGATRALADAEAALLEVSWGSVLPGMPVVEDVAVFMRDHGFAWHDVLGILRRPDDDALWQMDALFLKQDHPLRRRALQPVIVVKPEAGAGLLGRGSAAVESEQG